ncbi:uncharacterized protein LOC125940748 [Dermacentor silvarum]|uniref:uncharacterized protein LOC125940748 n=1 Tax=Dermacentor silvarum TaxID=543639 RepID=UPI0021009BA2|nr:uncharacterized protein LOC125940748 [Dermacentor silvarum]
MQTAFPHSPSLCTLPRHKTVLHKGIINGLRTMGVSGNALRFVHEFLRDRCVQVKLGSIMSDKRRTSLGVPQGSVLSHLLFNVVMASLPDALKVGRMAVKMSIYADGICIWISGYQHKRLARIAQGAISTIKRHLSTLGLSLSAEKSAFMLFPGVRRKSTRLTLNIRGHSILRATHIRFLGVTIDSKLLWRRAVESVVAASVQRVNALRRLAGVRWGNNPMPMLKLNAALITSRILYQLPLISPSSSQFEHLEALHRKGLHLAMGVPQAASNKKVTNEAESLPLRLLASQALLTQLLRLGESRAGTALLRRLRARTRSHFHAALNTFRFLGLEWPKRSRLEPLWSFSDVTCSLSVLHLPAKRTISTAEAKFIVLDHLSTAFQSHLQVYTDGSVCAQTAVQRHSAYHPLMCHGLADWIA